MKEPRWFWVVAAIGFSIVLFSTVRDGGSLIFGGAYAAFQLATHRGFDWRMPKRGGLLMLPVMLLVFLGTASVTESPGVAALFALAAAAVTLLAVGLRRTAS
jgi:hypothetical protein